MGASAHRTVGAAPGRQSLGSDSWWVGDAWSPSHFSSKTSRSHWVIIVGVPPSIVTPVGAHIKNMRSSAARAAATCIPGGPKCVSMATRLEESHTRRIFPVQWY